MSEQTPLEKVQGLADALAAGAEQAKAERAAARASMSTNDRAEKLMGRRPIGVIAFDQPVELGYWCPVCRVRPVVDGEFDERLHWSEYNGFLWCEVCNVDYPSVLCVQLDAEPQREWEQVGPAAAVKVYLDTVEQALRREDEQ